MANLNNFPTFMAFFFAKNILPGKYRGFSHIFSHFGEKKASGQGFRLRLVRLPYTKYFFLPNIKTFFL